MLELFITGSRGCLISTCDIDPEQQRSLMHTGETCCGCLTCTHSMKRLTCYSLIVM